jgi:hypothetical protein
MHLFSFNVKILARSPGLLYIAECIKRVLLKKLPRNVLARPSSINVELSAPILQRSQPAVTRPLPSVHNSDWRPLRRLSRKRRKRRQRRPRFVFIIPFTFGFRIHCVTARTHIRALRPQGVKAANEGWQGWKMIVTTSFEHCKSSYIVVFLTTFILGCGATTIIDPSETSVLRCKLRPRGLTQLCPQP